MAQQTCSRPPKLAAPLFVLALVLGTAASQSPAAAQSAKVEVTADSERVRIRSPFLLVEMDLRRPAISSVQVAPRGDTRHGVSIGSVVEEASVSGRRLNPTTEDRDGARATWQSVNGSIVVRLEGVDIGSIARSIWTVTVPPDSPSLQLDRRTTVRGNSAVQSTGLAVSSASIPHGTDPASLAYVVNGRTFRSEVGPEILEQSGGTLGLMAVDNPELTYTAQTDRPDRVLARQERAQTTLAFVKGLPVRDEESLVEERVTFRFGWDNHLLAPHSDFAPEVESRLLASGYFGNAVVSPALGAVVSASMRDYRGSVWSRDVDYALQGYGYVLEDMSVLGNTLQKFLERVDREGVAPEYMLLDGRYGNRESWDSMANVVQGTYSYVAKTGDLEFYRRNAAAVRKALDWIRALDTDDDGLPDRDIFPYGYTDTVENGPMHTYALAKFYAAFRAVADLEEADGRDPTPLREYADLMRIGFGGPVQDGGYWNQETGHPIAWKRASGQIFKAFETFGVFEAIRVGLLQDPEQLQSIGRWLDANRGAFINSNPYPERLMIGGYDLSVKKAEVPTDKLWILDSNAPWITGVSVPARVALGRVEEAVEMHRAYTESSNRSTPHAEFGAGPLGRYGPGETLDGGRLWDNWSWFSAVYGTHFGLKMTPRALEIAPAPLDPGGRHARGIIYQGARLEMELQDDGYRVKLDAPKRIVLWPLYGYQQLEVNQDGVQSPTRELIAEPGVDYIIRAYR